MIEYMISYQKRTEKLIHDNPANTDWNGEIKGFALRFDHLQKERQIHLSVMLTVGLAVLISSLTTIVYPILSLLLLDGMLFILFIAYILYYRRLENIAQSWYKLLDLLQEKQSKNP